MPADDAEPAARVLETLATPASLDELHALFPGFWEDAPSAAGMADRIAFETAVAELAANIVEHAAAGRPVVLRLELRADAVQAEAAFEDEGRPFEGDPAGSEPDDEAEHGRGLALASSLVDEVTYRRDGPLNRWTLVRRLRGDV